LVILQEAQSFINLSSNFEATMANSTKIRVDLLLVERGLVPSRERARALILAGRVLVAEQKVEKSGVTVPADAPIRLLGEDQPYVSRGGVKLAAALAHWQINVQGRACLDTGASTGGFTDCLLQAGAAEVTAVDTGFGQIAMKLRNDPRVRLLERTNARFLEPGLFASGALATQASEKRISGSKKCQNTTSPVAEKLIMGSKKYQGMTSVVPQMPQSGKVLYQGMTSVVPQMPQSGKVLYQGMTSVVPQMPKKEDGALAPEGNPALTLLVMDVSFISATLLLGPVFAAAPALTEAVILVKPQFEAGREHIGKGGIVRDPEAHQLAVDRVADCVRSLGWQVVETISSPITGAEGNREFLLYARRA
jgi:predicted rRNA methylase YqxC with S4 and FtsJ domains